MVPSFPQRFDSVAQTINKYTGEHIFAVEFPEIDWSIVSSEVITERRNMKQENVAKQYVQGVYRMTVAFSDGNSSQRTSSANQSTSPLLPTAVGRQTFSCINFGDKGIRINDVKR